MNDETETETTAGPASGETPSEPEVAAPARAEEPTPPTPPISDRAVAKLNREVNRVLARATRATTPEPPSGLRMPHVDEEVAYILAPGDPGFVPETTTVLAARVICAHNAEAVDLEVLGSKPFRVEQAVNAPARHELGTPRTWAYHEAM